MKKHVELLNEIKFAKCCEQAAENTKKNSFVFDGKFGLKSQNFVIDNDKIAKAMQKAWGRYVVVSFSQIFYASNDMLHYLIDYLSKTISSFFTKNLFDKNKSSLNKNTKILVVALGNKNVSPDSLGYQTIKNILVSENYSVLGEFKNKPQVYAISTSVYGATGIESSDIVKGVVEQVKPDYIITVDTFCANNWFRLGTSFQVNNAGVVPGEGLKNKRKNINTGSMGVPVISIGVPLVIYASSLLENVLDDVDFYNNVSDKEITEYAKGDDIEKLIGANGSEQYKKHLNSFLKNASFDFENKILNYNFNDLALTVNEIDEMVKLCGDVVGFAINKAIYGFDVDKQKKFINRV